MSFCDAFPYLESGCGMRMTTWANPDTEVRVDWSKHAVMIKQWNGEWITYFPTSPELFSEEWYLV